MALRSQQVSDLLRQRYADVRTGNLQGFNRRFIKGRFFHVPGRLQPQQQEGGIFRHEESFLFLMDLLFQFADTRVVFWLCHDYGVSGKARVACNPGQSRRVARQ